MRFIDGLSLVAAAAACKVSYDTARNWKRQTAADGNNWEHARAALKVSGRGVDALNVAMVEGMVRNFLAVIKLVEALETEPVITVQLMASLTDSYAKFSKAFTRINPEFSELGVALNVIKLMVDTLKARAPGLLAQFEPHLEAVGAAVTAKFSASKW